MSLTAKAHGLDGTLVEPDWPPLTLEEVSSVLARYPQLQRPFRILSLSPRPLSSACVVEARNQCVFVKRHARAVRNVEALREEHRFMEHLRARGALVPQVLMNRDGETVTEENEWTYETHSIPAGTDAYHDAISWTPFRSVHHARSAGRIMARLHRAAEGFDAPVRAGCPLVAGFTIFRACDPEEELKLYIASRPLLAEYLQQNGCVAESLELLAPFHSELLPFLRAPKPLWTHNDLHPSNLFWSDAGQSAQAISVIDFGLCDRTTAVHDIAHAIERSIVEWLVLVNNPEHPEIVPAHMKHLWALLEGYESERPLTPAEATALAPMLALCHAEFALSETDYFLSILNSREKAYMACEGYLVSHARWWHGAGAELLQRLRIWADTKAYCWTISR